VTENSELRKRVGKRTELLGHSDEGKETVRTKTPEWAK